MASFNVEMFLSLVDRASGPLRRVSAGMAALGRQAAGLDAPGAIAAANQRRLALVGQATAFTGIAFAARRALSPAIEFEAAMADVAKVVDFDDDEGIPKLASDILELSRRIPIAADGLAAIVAAAGQASLVDSALPDDEQRAQLVRFGEAAAKMGVAFDIGAAEAGQAMASLRNVFGLTQDQVERLADANNFLSNNMASTARDITNVETRVGGVAQLFGLATEETAALSSAFLALSLGPERASTAINAMLSRLVTAPKQSKDFQAALRELGTDAGELGKAIREDASGALLAFLERVRSSKDALGILTDLFGRENADEIALLTGSLDQARKAFGLVADETLFAGSMQKEFEARSRTTENALELLGNRATAVAVTLGAALLPAIVRGTEGLGPWLDGLSAWATRNGELVEAIGLTTAAIVALRLAFFAAGLLFGATPLGRAITALTVAASVVIAAWAPIKQFFDDLFSSTNEGLKTLRDGTGGALTPEGFVAPRITPEGALPPVFGSREDFGIIERQSFGGNGGGVAVRDINITAPAGSDPRAIADEVMRRLRAEARGAGDLFDRPGFGRTA